MEYESRHISTIISVVFKSSNPEIDTTYCYYNHNSPGTMLSLKILLLPEFLSLHSGIGYGVSDLGHYTNINIGCILGFENKYIVPFIYFGTYYGMPINPKSYDLSLLGDDQKGEHLYTPTNTTGILYNVGLKLPIGLWISNENDLSLYGSFGSAQVADERMDNDFLKIGIGIEIHLITKECKK